MNELILKSVGRTCLTLSLTCSLIMASSPDASAASAALDQSFAIGVGSGFPTDPENIYWPQIQAVAVQADGKVLAGGQALFTNFNGTPVRALVRVNVDGSLDTAFQSNVGTGPTVPGGGPGEINRIVIQPDGKILICGDFNTVNGIGRNAIARLNADGSVDTGFMVPGGGVGGTPLRYVEDIALQPDGKVLIGGGFQSYSGTARRSVARLNTDGSLDTTFHSGFPAGLGTSSVVRSLGVQSDGKIYVGGTFTSWLDMPTPGIVRLHSDGSLDTSFIPTHIDQYPSVQALHVVGDGSVLVGGFIENTGTSTRFFARLKADGSLDTSFPAGTGVRGWVADIQSWPDGGYLVAGRFREVSGQSRGEMAIINADGT